MVLSYVEISKANTKFLCPKILFLIYMIVNLKCLTLLIFTVEDNSI